MSSCCGGCGGQNTEIEEHKEQAAPVSEQTESAELEDSVDSDA